MINKRLINTVGDSKKYIAGNVLCQWLSLLADIGAVLALCLLAAKLYGGSFVPADIAVTAAAVIFAVAVRAACSMLSSRFAYLSSKRVKSELRRMIYEKLLRLGPSRSDGVSASEVVQVSVEGVDQLETYFGSYLPQLFYAVSAVLTLFAALCFVSVLSAVVLLVCVPLIPVSIMLVSRRAKKLLARYWNKYTALGDTFLENLQGLTTLKIYKTDAYKNDEMNARSEEFRKVTMKVLTMQLNSVTIMDAVACGGAAAGIITAVLQLQSGAVGLSGGLLIILLSAEFFIPMRRLGSFFHVAMNSAAAADKIFRLLDLPENDDPEKEISGCRGMECSGLCFSYDSGRAILNDVTMNFPQGSFTAIVGESGCGKSTAASVLTGRIGGYSGSVRINGVEVSEISRQSLMKNITLVGHNSPLFKGTVRENLIVARPKASDSELWSALERVKLSDFIKAEGGLDFEIAERGSNLSGGQRQRLALARAVLHDSPAYIFDEATSNIDVESENDIINLIYELAETKTVILISHRLANVRGADNIYVLDGGRVAESGTHAELLKKGGSYAKLWSAQQELENFVRSGESR